VPWPGIDWRGGLVGADHHYNLHHDWSFGMIGMRRLAMVILTVMTLSATVRESFAQTVPYKASGTGVYSPTSGHYSGSGVATHLGKHKFLGNIATFPTDNPLVFDFVGTVPQTTIAANGDTIFFSLSGQVELIPLDSTFTTFSAKWTGEFVVVGGTGRFANVGPAAQPLQVIAINDPFTLADPAWTFSWELDGSIELH
jgi:hypothetical protein